MYDLAGYREGMFELQEEASQLIALLTAAEPGWTVVDAGAGAGGKTLALGAMMQGVGRLVAIDTAANRLTELAMRAERAGLPSVEILPVTTAASREWEAYGKHARKLGALRGRADVALVDAPCSGTGVIRRNPDAKWRNLDVDRLMSTQLAMLRNAGRLVRPGGILVYATCAIERSENEQVVRSFLDETAGEFLVEDAVARLSAAIARAEPNDSAIRQGGPLSAFSSGPYFRSWPHRHGLDSFFAAVLRRV